MIQHVDNARVVQGGDAAHLSPKHLLELRVCGAAGGQHLDGHRELLFPVQGTPDNAHPSSSQGAEKLKGTESGRCRRHGCTRPRDCTRVKRFKGGVTPR